MARDALQGLAETYRLLDALPSEAEQQLVVEMGIIGREILAAQRADVAKDTGALAADLSLALLVDRLRLRVGLLQGGRDARKFNGRSRKAVAGGPFYGRFVEFGRKGQTVVVTRRIKKRRLKGNNRAGNARRTVFGGASDRLRRRGPNRGTAIGSPYRMRVKALGERPYVRQPLFQEAASQHLAEFWAKILARTGAAA